MTRLFSSQINRLHLYQALRKMQLSTRLTCRSTSFFWHRKGAREKRETSRGRVRGRSSRPRTTRESCRFNSSRSSSSSSSLNLSLSRLTKVTTGLHRVIAFHKKFSLVNQSKLSKVHWTKPSFNSFFFGILILQGKVRCSRLQGRIIA